MEYKSRPNDIVIYDDFEKAYCVDSDTYKPSSEDNEIWRLTLQEGKYLEYKLVWQADPDHRIVGFKELGH